MSAPQWKPGDVGLVKPRVNQLAECVSVRRGGEWVCEHGTVVDRAVTSARPLVVIDPEDREQVERLTSLVYEGARDRPYEGGAFEAMQAALRSLVTPPKPKPQVYSHLRSGVDPDDISVALCGKVWRVGEDVDVVGQCPNCRDLAEEWVA